MKKFVNISNVKNIDEENRIVTFVATKEVPDRDGDIVKISGIDIKNYVKNPIVLANHFYSIENSIGKTVAIEFLADEMLVKIQFSEKNEKGILAFELVKEGIVNSVSIGFIAKERSRIQSGDKEYNVFTKVELLEISVVAVPANPEALAKAIKKGIMKEEDAEKFAKEMEKEELEYLRKKKEILEREHNTLKLYRKGMQELTDIMQIKRTDDETETASELFETLKSILKEQTDISSVTQKETISGSNILKSQDLVSLTSKNLIS